MIDAIHVKAHHHASGAVGDRQDSDTLNQMALTYPDKSISRYSWDEINRLTSVRDASNNLIECYQIDNANRFNRLDYGNGLAEGYEYDALATINLRIINRTGKFAL